MLPEFDSADDVGMAMRKHTSLELLGQNLDGAACTKTEPNKTQVSSRYFPASVPSHFCIQGSTQKRSGRMAIGNLLESATNKDLLVVFIVRLPRCGGREG